MSILEVAKGRHVIVHFVKEPKDLGLPPPFLFKDQWFKAKEIDHHGVWVEMPEMMGTLVIQHPDGKRESQSQKLPVSGRLILWKYVESITIPDEDVEKERMPMGFVQNQPTSDS
jgi:hypothetical protein